ncbi:hypothetical protein GGR57DRAFT_475441 [Xylariaceae sp. FL1272]|nr:hypothetical protein GGR57DRAFT_475441 [Xylariaceae sp. FL1272]
MGHGSTSSFSSGYTAIVFLLLAVYLVCGGAPPALDQTSRLSNMNGEYMQSKLYCLIPWNFFSVSFQHLHLFK